MWNVGGGELTNSGVHWMNLPFWAWGAFVGDKGMLLVSYPEHELWPADKFEGYDPPEPSIPPSVGHYQEWLDACRCEGEALCHFGYSGTRKHCFRTPADRFPRATASLYESCGVPPVPRGIKNRGCQIPVDCLQWVHSCGGRPEAVRRKTPPPVISSKETKTCSPRFCV